MALYLGILTFSFIVSSLSLVPYIDFLYRQHPRQAPARGGVFLLFLLPILYLLIFPLIQKLGVYVTSLYESKQELNILFFTFFSFGLLGLYDDLVKPIPPTRKLFLKALLSSFVSLLIFINLKIDFLNIPFIGVFHLGWYFVPLSTFLILLFARGVNTTRGHDGLTAGLLLISLIALWFLSVTALDTPLAVFVAIWIGALISFLYFNVYPARIRLGSVGGIAFGATLAVIGLLLGKILALVVVGALFVSEAVFPAHHYFERINWQPSKIMLRYWLAAMILAIFGIWLALL